ncbi:flagellin [Succinimonas sp.]|uniref:flagellin N-terminal helical domain-containing protein n=1 Tax=Succinimonas sp. TaxID=1936151 RepID=UPI003864E2D8
MALYITNIASINAQRMLANSTNALDTSYKRLASGLRINSAKDDAAGLQIADRLTSQINGLKQGNRNAMDGISFAQTAEGAMDEMVTMYQRIRTLALQSANGTNSDADRTAIQQEVSSLCAEIDRISKDTTYGGQNIFERAASDRTISFQVGADANQTISMNLAAKFTKTVGTGEDAHEVEETAAKWSVKELAAAMGITDGIANCSATDFSGSDGKAFDVSTAAGAQSVLENIDKFIAAVDSKRAEFGAVQNRLESTIRNQSNVAENVEAARSRIRDTDFAEETSNMIQQNIIQQAAQAMLSQANQRSQMILSLLGG